MASSAGSKQRIPAPDVSGARTRAISVVVLAAAALAGIAAPASAQAGQDAPASDDPIGAMDPDVTSSGDDLPTYRARARADAPSPDSDGRAATRVTRDEMDERIARSAPDALTWVPGVTVQ